MAASHLFSTTPPSAAMEPLQGPYVAQGFVLPLDYMYTSASTPQAAFSQTQNSEHYLPHAHHLATPYSFPTFNIHARIFVSGAREHPLKAGLSVHPAGFVPSSQNNNIPTGYARMDALATEFLPGKQEHPHINYTSSILRTTLPTSELAQPLAPLAPFNVHAPEFRPAYPRTPTIATSHGSQSIPIMSSPDDIPSSSRSLNAGAPVFSPGAGSWSRYVFEVQPDFDAEALYRQRRVEDASEDQAQASRLHIQGFYFPTFSNRDDYIPPVFTPFRNLERFRLPRVGYEEQTPESCESSRRHFVLLMHDGDKKIVKEDSDKEGRTEDTSNEDEGKKGKNTREILDPQTDYEMFTQEELQSLKCVHHFNVLGRPVLGKSGTAPSTTIAILKSTPKHLNVTAPNGLWKSAIMECATQLLDPVAYYGKMEVLETLRGSNLENACIGQCKKTYSGHGWWMYDTYGPEEYPVGFDSLEPDFYPDPSESIMINGVTKGFADRVGIITAAAKEQEKEDAARKAAFNARLAQGRTRSRLGVSYFTHEDIEEVPAFTSHQRTASSFLRHTIQRSVRRPTTITMPAQSTAGRPNDVVAPGRYTTGGSLPREEWKRRLAATEDRPVAACWADDEDEDEQEIIVPTLPPLATALESSSSAAPGPEDGSLPTVISKTTVDEEIVNAEDFHDNDNRRVSSSSASTTVEHSRASSVNVAETPDTSLQVSENEDAESKAATDDDSDSIYDGVERAVGKPRSSEGEGPEISDADGFDDMSFGEEDEAIQGRPLNADTDTEDEAEEEVPASTARMLASGLHAHLDAIEIAMRSASTSPTSLVPLGPMTPRVALRIPSLINALDQEPSSTLVRTPESSAPTFVDSPSIPTPSPRHRGLIAPSNPAIVVLTPTGPLPRGPQPAVHRFSNGAIPMTLPGRRPGLVLSPVVHFDRLPANFDYAHLERASAPLTWTLSQENRPTVGTEDVFGVVREATGPIVQDTPRVDSNAQVAAASQWPVSPQAQGSPSIALVLYRRPAPLDNSMLRYFQAWNRLLAAATSNGEYFWQCVLRCFCIENYLDTISLGRSAAIYEVGENDGNAVRAMSPQVNDEHGIEEEIAGNVIQSDITLTPVTEVNVATVGDISLEATVREEHTSSSAQELSLPSSLARIGSSSASRRQRAGRRVHFALPPSRSTSMVTAAPSPSAFSSFHHVLYESEMALPPCAYDQWPDFNGVHCIASSPPASPSSITWGPTCEVSRFSWTSSDNEDSEVANAEHTGNGEEDSDDDDDVEDEVLRPVPRLPTFQRTRQGWQYASWKFSRRRLTKRRPPTRNRHGASTGINVSTTSTATTDAPAQATYVEFPESRRVSDGSTASTLRSVNAVTRGLWKKGVQRVKGIFTRKN